MALGFHIVRRKIAKDFHRQAGARDQHIQAALPALAVHRTKTRAHIASGRAAIANANENHVALIPLHILQVFYKKAL